MVFSEARDKYVPSAVERSMRDRFTDNWHLTSEEVRKNEQKDPWLTCQQLLF